MTLRKGNMWTTKADLILVTGNATIKANGALVMGRGAAREARDKFPGLDADLSWRITRHKKEIGKYQPYGIILAEPNCLQLGVFQVKRHFADKAELELIEFSVQKLMEFYSTLDVAVNFPGIGNGGLAKASVLPLLKYLPDNVEVWEYAEVWEFD